MAVNGRRQLVRWRPGATPDGGGGGGRRQRRQRRGTAADGCGQLVLWRPGTEADGRVQLARSRLAVVTAGGGITPRLRDAGGGRWPGGGLVAGERGAWPGLNDAAGLLSVRRQKPVPARSRSLDSVPARCEDVRQSLIERWATVCRARRRSWQRLAAATHGG